MSTPAQRDIRSAAFCWQHKAARRAIRDAFDATNDVATALGVYDGLTEIASDAQSETFTTTLAWIQGKTGVSVSTVKKHLSRFSELRLVAISTPRLRAPSTYILLSIANSCPAQANGCLAIANEGRGAPLAPSEESEKKSEQGGEEAPAPSSASPSPTDLQTIADRTGLDPQTAALAVEEFAVAKANWPADPRTAEAIAGWLIDTRKGKEALARLNARSAPATSAGPFEPSGWREWLNKHRPESAYAANGEHAGLAWPAIDPAARAYIAREMKGGA